MDATKKLGRDHVKKYVENIGKSQEDTARVFSFNVGGRTFFKQ